MIRCVPASLGDHETDRASDDFMGEGEEDDDGDMYVRG